MDSPLRPSQIPSNGSKGVHDWCELAIQEGEAFLSSQPGYTDIPHIIKAIQGRSYEDKLRSQTISQLQLNHVGRIGLDLASSLTDIKPFWEYKVSNQRYEPQAVMSQKLASSWWTRQGIDLKFFTGIQSCLSAGSFFAHLVYNPLIKDLDMLPEDARDVLPIRPSDLMSIQNSFGVVIRRERTVNWLRAMYPAQANRIQADRDLSPASNRQPSAYQSGLVSGFLANLRANLGNRPKASLSVPVADQFTIYVKDDSQNLTGERQLMGEAGTNWCYWVEPGEALYPRGRCIVICRSSVEPLYDGPNIYWHGMFPLPKLTLDPWPGMWLGKSPLKDILSIQTEIDKTARGIADLMEKNWRPDLIGDQRTLSKAAQDRIDTRRAGLRLRTDLQKGQNVLLQYPQMQGAVAAFEWLNFLITQAKELSGTQELSSLVQLGQIPSSETIERMMESWSPAIRLRSRVMEAFLREVAMITLSNFMQWYTLPQRLQVLGNKGMTFEDFDFDPESMVPDMGDPSRPRYERAREFMRMFAYQIAPGSLLAASEVTDKLMYLQLSRMGFVDPITLLQKLGVNNIASASVLDQAGDTIMERLQWAQSQGIQMSVGPAGASAAGRKASGQALPRMVVKES